MPCMITPDELIDIVCQSLEIDKDKLLVEKSRGNQKHRDARLLATYLMRKYVFEIKTIKALIKGKRFWTEAEVPKTFKSISEYLKRGSPQSSMLAYNTCYDLLRVDKEFRIKYQVIVEEIEKRGYIQIQTQNNG